METLSLKQLIADAEANGADFKKVRLDVPGPYRCEVTHMRYKVSKAENPGFAVRVKLVEGPNAGKALWTDFYLTPLKKDGERNTAGIAIFFRQLAALGFDIDEFKRDVNPLNVEAAVASNRAIGKVVDVEVEDHTYNGETSSRIKNMKAVQSGVAPAAPVAVASSGFIQTPPSTPFNQEPAPVPIRTTPF